MQELPKNPTLFLRWAVAAYNRDQFKRSAFLCRIHLLRHRNEYFGLCWLANTLYQIGSENDAKAEQLFLRALKINSSHPLAHFGLGRLHHGNAIKLFQRFSFARGSEAIVFHDEMSAKEYLSQSTPEGIGSMGDQEVGNRNVAVQELRLAIQLCDDLADKVSFLYMIAAIECTRSNKKAIRVYKEILSLAPDEHEAHCHLAGCYAALGDADRARKSYLHVKRHAPDMASKLEEVLQHFGIKSEQLDSVNGE